MRSPPVWRWRHTCPTQRELVPALQASASRRSMSFSRYYTVARRGWHGAGCWSWQRGYVGCGVLASAVGMDKIACKAVFAAAACAAALSTDQTPRLGTQPAAVIASIEAALRYPVFVKPANLGSSIGISKAHDTTELAAALTDAARYDRRCLWKRRCRTPRDRGQRPGNDDPVASVPGEVVPSSEFYDYAAKYIDGKSGC